MIWLNIELSMIMLVKIRSVCLQDFALQRRCFQGTYRSRALSSGTNTLILVSIL
jgi:hypothetical protein